MTNGLKFQSDRKFGGQIWLELLPVRGWHQSAAQLAFLLISFIAANADPSAAKPDQAAEAGNTAVCAEISASLTGARKYFLQSTVAALKDIRSGGKPRQADLYILVHYLMYRRSLALDQADLELSNGLDQNIINFFMETFESGVWRNEGCLLIKLLIGLRDYPVPYSKIEPLEKYYAALIQENWKSEGVGECFSDQIERTFQLDVRAVCSRPSNELEAKVGYYNATTPSGRPNLLMPVKLPFLSDLADRDLVTWWRIIPDLWILRTYHDQIDKLISLDRFEAAKHNFATAVGYFLTDSSDRAARDADLLLYGHLLSEEKFSADDRKLLRALLNQQQKDGSFPARIGSTPAGHNTQATPTNFAIEALTESAKRLCPNAASRKPE